MADLPRTARASVALPGATGEVREFELAPPGAGEGWLEVTASGICGTDVGLFARGVSEPTVLGHHVVGRVAALGEGTAQRRGLAAGDRVVLEEYLPCGRCAVCARGPYRLCPETDIWGGGRRIGMIPAAERPGLTGGNGEFVFLPANAVTHRLPAGLTDELAAWVLPYANAIDWVTGAGGLRPDETVVVMGPGYHGLAVAAAARWAGASRVVVTGLPRDRERLAMAEALGALPVVVDDPAATAERIGALTHRPADVVVDTVGTDPSVLGPALDTLGHGGRLVLTHPKRPGAIPLDSGLLIRRGLRVTGVRGRSPEAISAAIASLADGSAGLGAVPTVEVDLEGAADMLSRLAAGTGPESPHVVVRP
ncbi:zinc-dependent alcohol dehydrogenase [Amycolatopsis thermophila]|uniref:Threonine dehydrogenase-like Zn-dependent dehydrogenase n=1 Tax=Amycolatopsis thermophila TaxID=206084 RepID=A0ABU0F7L2_9PSEU|nr:zinc-binding dehydrogenase [Amycolatopsis thermophila]MDQ0383035.1 threonine dehydrogenase-like Zn-dependent dehydrogenase [Amycolatopsis thermophila]